ncbi:MAG: phosphonoacetate hydrolase [Verrucomicrobiota bacterium]|nr:phosphonoacetate hydrolase [Verrucomicrobiota bacterium]
MEKIILSTISLNQNSYTLPNIPVVVICADGWANEYISLGFAHGELPNLARLASDGYYGLARGALPSFTNVNNCSIVTGTPPSETGIGGNYIIDPESGEELMTNSSRFLRNDTILAAASQAGRKVAMVTAKDKLRELLSKGMDGISISAEKADEVSLELNGIDNVESLVGPKPVIYSADASLYVLRVGVELLASGRADFLYLSLTDYMQHKYAPEAPESREFYRLIDVEIGKLLDLNAAVGVTADHGMNAKCNSDGEPNVIFLETDLTREFGDGIRVICPITDPYVVHHGALGSAVTIYLPDGIDVQKVADWIAALDGVAEVYSKDAAIVKLELPGDRIGDLFVLSERDWVVGRTPEHHDLGKLEGTLRSHGGRYEEMVPFLVSKPLNNKYEALAKGDPRNFDIFDFVCNGIKS